VLLPRNCGHNNSATLTTMAPAGTRWHPNGKRSHSSGFAAPFQSKLRGPWWCGARDES
jgi:hypothetical protein